MAYQSAILCASPLTAIAMDPTFPRMALGAADGVVRFFDLASLPAVRSLQVRKLLGPGLNAACSSLPAVVPVRPDGWRGRCVIDK